MDLAQDLDGIAQGKRAERELVQVVRFESWGTAAFRDWKIGGISKVTTEQPFKKEEKQERNIVESWQAR